MKTRLATNIYGYPLRLALLFEQAYSDGVNLILSCLNTNRNSGLDFSIISVFQANSCFEGKSWKNCLSSVAQKT